MDCALAWCPKAHYKTLWRLIRFMLSEIWQLIAVLALYFYFIDYILRNFIGDHYFVVLNDFI